MKPLSTEGMKIFAHAGLCFQGLGVAKESGPEALRQQRPGLNITADVERLMSLIPDTAGVRPAQDPLIEQARLVNEWARIERNLAARKALRPARSEAARKGWEARRG